jgi:hypothetical protein
VDIKKISAIDSWAKPCLHGSVNLRSTQWWWWWYTRELFEKWQVLKEHVTEIYLKISYSFPYERIHIFVTVIHFGHANISEKVKT